MHIFLAAMLWLSRMICVADLVAAGLFLHVSGMTYTFDPKAEPGKRVQEAKIGEEGEEEQLDKKKKYTVACRSRLAFGAGTIFYS